MKTLALVSCLGLIACQGPAGAPGADGQMGTMGLPGLPGSSAAKGDTGAQGPQGSAGPAGAQGVAGKDGVGLVQTLQNVLDRVMPRRTSIMNAFCNQGQHGTAFKLSDGRVVTAGHVVAGATSCDLVDEKNTDLGKAAVWTAPIAGRDLVISTPAWNTAGAALVGFDTVKAYSAAVGELVMMAGYPGMLAQDMQFVFGYVSDSAVTSVASPLYSGAVGVDYAATGGTSGSPVFNGKGDLVGVNVAVFTDSQITIFLPLIGL